MRVTLPSSWNQRRLVGLGLRLEMIPNGDKISVFQNEDGTVPSEGEGPAVILKFLEKRLVG